MPSQQDVCPGNILVRADAKVAAVLQGVTCGQLATVMLHTVDRFSNPRVSGGEQVAAQLHGGPSHSVPSTIKVKAFPGPWTHTFLTLFQQTDLECWRQIRSCARELIFSIC